MRMSSSTGTAACKIPMKIFAETQFYGRERCEFQHIVRIGESFTYRSMPGDTMDVHASVSEQNITFVVKLKDDNHNRYNASQRFTIISLSQRSAFSFTGRGSLSQRHSERMHAVNS